MKFKIILTAVLAAIIFLVGVPVAAVALKGGLGGISWTEIKGVSFANKIETPKTI